MTNPLKYRFVQPFIQTALLALTVGIIVLPTHTAFAAPANDIVIGDFEEAGYGRWVTSGAAFGTGPARGKVLRQIGEEGIRGNGAASSESAGDGPTGTLTSPVFRLARRYLSFVIGGGSYEGMTCLNLIVGGKVVCSATGENSDRLRPVSWDISRWRGMAARVQIVDNVSGDWGHIIIDHILQTDQPERLPAVTQPLYGETWRPQFHFTARQWTEQRLNPGQREEGWCNDLNGLVYYDGEYHLFAQRWNRCWIHAVSRDLVHWTELEPAFFEESLNSGVQSGNCVIDYQNTSGLSPSKATPPMVAFWSRNDNRSQCLSYSLDHGRTWKFYAHNPILVHPERDPMVFWHEPTRRWVMMMYGDGQYHIFTSPNLLDWHDEKRPIPNSFECPDFFELPLDGDKSKMKWVLIRGNGKYSVGSFDGTQFTEETPQFDSDAGPNFYATQSWGNTETGDGRRIQAAWMRGGVYPDMPFNQQVTFPCELTLHTTPSGPRLHRQPIREIASLHTHEDKWTNRSLKPGEALELKQSGDLFHIKMNVRIPEGATLTLTIRGVPLVLTHQSIACGTDPQPVSGE
ncbi:MAG: glycoside hydrolase family 32 protein, partial [Armatimonadota bacterium]|nr:glycoside hydrolase family 32 protein [Armatimonadota bacterium]